MTKTMEGDQQFLNLANGMQNPNEMKEMMDNLMKSMGDDTEFGGQVPSAEAFAKFSQELGLKGDYSSTIAKIQ